MMTRRGRSQGSAKRCSPAPKESAKEPENSRSGDSAAGGGRRRLLETATRLFASKGYTATSVRDIVSAAGVTAPSLYHHFGNKEGLFRAIVRANRSRVEAARKEVLAGGGSAAERITRLSRTYFALSGELADFAWVLVRIVTGPRKASPQIDLRALARERIRHFEELVEEGVASGEFRPYEPRHVALALAGAVSIACRMSLVALETGDMDAELDGMVAVILAGIAAGRAGRARPQGLTSGSIGKS
jgi:AcrR family transcriptional regulator